MYGVWIQGFLMPHLYDTRARRSIHFILLMVLLVSALSRAQTNQFPMFPNPILMPRDVLTSDASVVCVTRYASSARKVPKSLKRTVFLSYGITKRPSDWEVDHLVSLELGGSNSIKNLWSDGVVAWMVGCGWG